MIELRHLSKTYVVNGIRKVVARDLTFTFPAGQSVALLGRNGAGKSSLLRMIAGVMDPDSGQVIRHGSVSWPVGFAGSFHGDLTGAQNAKFIGRIYGVETDAMVDFVRDFCGLGEHYHLPVRTYSSGMRARLAFACSMAIRFDTYLIDEVTAVGDGAFRAKSEVILLDRLRTSGAIVVAHGMEILRKLCTAGVVLENGRLFYYPRIERAIEHHEHVLRGQLPPWMR